MSPKSERIVLRLCFVFVVYLWMGTCTAFAMLQQPGTPSFKIKVPKKTTSGQMPIAKLKVTVSLAAEPDIKKPVTFRITDPSNNISEMTFEAKYKPTSNYPYPERTFKQGNLDDIVLVKWSGEAAQTGDPLRKRYLFIFDLGTDYDKSCSNLMSQQAEYWEIAVINSSPLITGVCVKSFDLNESGKECQLQRLIPETEPVATVTSAGGGIQNCLEDRPPVDVILVLDKSGSMNSYTQGGATGTKMEALHDAVEDFVKVWDELRKSESTPPSTPPSDNIGIVFFDSDAYWVNDPKLPGGSWTLNRGLNSFNGTTLNEIINKIRSIKAGGLTSIGDGLVEASTELFSANYINNGHRKVILLMSNGMENTDKRVKVDNPTTPTQVQTYSNTGISVTTPLPNQSMLQIYSVTVGTSTAVSADINEDIATATKGFYINTETNAELLRPYFLELLQNFLKFNTHETVRMIAGRVTQENPFSTIAPITSTSQSVSVNLMWNQNFGDLRLVVTPPNGAPIVGSRGNGSSFVNQKLPLPSPAASAGEWNIRVEMLRTRNIPEIPFDLIVLADDEGLKSELSIVPADYAPGDNIRLQARVTNFGRPVLRLGTNPTDRLVVNLVKPGTGIGDLLSRSRASTTPATPSDPTTNANAKLQNELTRNPSALVRSLDTITLLDNGAAANGDDVAGDGIYSALYNAPLVGHYDFLFGIEGTTSNLGHFSRQQLMTVHVRGLPNAAATEFQTSVQGRGNARTLVIQMTPRTKLGNLLGPGWAPYFWFTAPGRKPFKPTDNLNGTFTARLPFAGANPPPVKVHFIRISASLDEEITPNKLPVLLNESNLFINRVPPPRAGR